MAKIDCKNCQEVQKAYDELLAAYLILAKLNDQLQAAYTSAFDRAKELNDFIKAISKKGGKSDN